MTRLQQRHLVERQQLESLRDSLESRAHDLKSFIEVLESCYTFSSLDPVEHLKAAMRNYLEIKGE